MSENTKATLKTLAFAIVLIGTYAAVWSHKFGHWAF
jgi:hypothetical protein